MTKLKRSILIATAVLAILVSTATAQTTRLLPFQGRLTDAQGQSVGDGAKLIQFQIYGEPSGGSALWAGEVHRTTVNGGLVNVILGSRNPLPVNRADNPDRSFFDASLYLQITVDGNNDGKIDQADPPLLPRQAILPVIFANESANSHKLNGYDWRVLFGSSNPETGTLLDGKVRDGSLAAGKLKAGTITSNQIGGASIDLSNLAQQIIDKLCPAGSVMAFAGSSTQVPVGWLLCDGASVNRSSFPKLFAVIGTAFGIPENEASFKVPDLRGRAVFGAGIGIGLTARPLAAVGGEEKHQLSIDEMPSHKHNTPLSLVRDAHFQSGPYPGVVTENNTESTATGGDKPHNTMPPYLILNYIIKVN